MKRLSLLVSDVYNKYLPISEKQKIELNLNITDYDSEVADIDEIQSQLDEQLQNLLQNSRKNGAVSLGVQQDYIVIRDSETVLSPLVCAALSRGRVKVKSRVGFGTTIYISVKPMTSEKQKQIDASGPKSSKVLENPKSVKSKK